MYFNHTFSMPDETLQNGKNIHLTTKTGNGSKEYSATGLGFSIAMLPAVMIEDVSLRLSHLKPLSAFPRRAHDR